MQINSVEDKLFYNLLVIYDAEIRFLESQQHMIRQTRNEPLIVMLLRPIEESQQQIKNLRLVLGLIDRHPSAICSEAVTGLIKDTQVSMQKSAINPDILDGVLVEAQMKMKGFEIACYCALVRSIKQIGQTAMLSLIGENLQQERETLQLFEQLFEECSYTMPKSGTRIRPL